MEVLILSARSVELVPTAPDGIITSYTDDKPITSYVGATAVVTQRKNIVLYREITAEQHAAYAAARDAALAEIPEEGED